MWQCWDNFLPTVLTISTQDGTCIRGDNCPYAHNVFEYWLHPTRYRTQLCNDGPNCRRRICFFAHTLDQLRVPASKPYVSPEVLAAATAAAASGKLVDSSGVPAAISAGGQRWVRFSSGCVCGIAGDDYV